LEGSIGAVLNVGNFVDLELIQIYIVCLVLQTGVTCAVTSHSNSHSHGHSCTSDMAHVYIYKVIYIYIYKLIVPKSDPLRFKNVYFGIVFT
jgi:hypothetical protein